jgi:hypothetical protein
MALPVMRAHLFRRQPLGIVFDLTRLPHLREERQKITGFGTI